MGHINIIPPEQVSRWESLRCRVLHFFLWERYGTSITSQGVQERYICPRCGILWIG